METTFKVFAKDLAVAMSPLSASLFGPSYHLLQSALFSNIVVSFSSQEFLGCGCYRSSLVRLCHYWSYKGLIDSHFIPSDIISALLVCFLTSSLSSRLLVMLTKLFEVQEIYAFVRGQFESLTPPGVVGRKKTTYSQKIQ